MKKTLNRLESYRVTCGVMASTSADGRNGAFLLPPKLFGYSKGLVLPKATLVLSDGSDWEESNRMSGGRMGSVAWEHASLSWPDRTPSWAEMCRLKDLIWDEHEVVLQFHPDKRSYVNLHDHCLHLWKPVGVDFPVPPAFAVGPTLAEYAAEIGELWLGYHGHRSEVSDE